MPRQATLRPAFFAHALLVLVVGLHSEEHVSAASNVAFQATFSRASRQQDRTVLTQGSNLCPRTKVSAQWIERSSRPLRLGVALAASAAGESSGATGDGLDPPTLQSVKNVRDLASVRNSPIKSGRIFRAACVGTANEGETDVIVDNFKTLIDLRSEKEWSGDVIKYNSTVFDSYDSMIYKVEKSKRTGRPKLYAQTEVQSSSSSTTLEGQARSRHMLSVIDESIYKRGVFKRLGTKKKLKAALYMGINFGKARKIFLDYINDAGLPLLNELILDYGGPAIKAVMEVLSEKENLPVAFYCTAGKDRTGLVSMLVLSALGVGDEDIIEDYVKSDTVYADLNDKSAMVGALKQEQLDPERFLRAPRSVMEQTIELLKRDYGGAEAYLDSIGFGADKIVKLRQALCDE